MHTPTQDGPRFDLRHLVRSLEPARVDFWAQNRSNPNAARCGPNPPEKKRKKENDENSQVKKTIGFMEMFNLHRPEYI